MCLHTFHRYHHCKHVGRWDIDMCVEPVRGQTTAKPGTKAIVGNTKSLRKSFVCKNNKIEDRYLVVDNKIAGFCPSCIRLGFHKPICIVTGIAPDDPKWVPKEDSEDEDGDSGNGEEHEKITHAAEMMAGVGGKVGDMSMEKENWEDIFFESEDEDEHCDEDDAEEENSVHDAHAPAEKKEVGELEHS